MDQRQQQQLDELLAKAGRERGLGTIDHRRLTRLIEQADAETELLIRGASPGKVIFTSRSGESLSAPRSGAKVGGLNR